MQNNQLKEVENVLNRLRIKHSPSGSFNKSELLGKIDLEYPLLIQPNDYKSEIGYFEDAEKLVAAMTLWNDSDYFEVKEVNDKVIYWLVVNIKKNYSVKTYREKTVMFHDKNSLFSYKPKKVWRSIEMGDTQYKKILLNSFLILEQTNCKQFAIFGWQINGRNPKLDFIHGK